LLAATSGLDPTAQAIAIAGAALLFFFVLELLRRRHLGEPYAILWLVASVVLLVLAIWKDLLNDLADLVGIASPANALFAVAFGYVMILLLAFSAVLSRLSRENRVLAQEIARLNSEVRGSGTDAGTPPVPPGRDARQESPIPK
jgi:hypothetical protein